MCLICRFPVIVYFRTEVERRETARRLKQWKEEKRRNREKEEEQKLAEETQRRRQAKVAVCFRGY